MVRAASAALLCLLALLCALPALAQGKSASALYRELSTGLDPQRVFRVRDAWLDREDLHVSLGEGTVAFTQAVDGRITGAFFEGDGEVLVSPPDQVERWSMNVFTGAAVLTAHFNAAYLRFNDDTFAQLEPDLRPPEDAAAFIAKWDDTVRRLSRFAALRLLQSLVDGPSPRDRMLYASLVGTRLGNFDVFFDTLAPEQITVGQAKEEVGRSFYDIWTAFPMRSVRGGRSTGPRAAASAAQPYAPADPVRITRIRIDATVTPPTQLEAEATLDLEARESGPRLLLFELSRYLQVREVTSGGRRLEFVQNEALEGSELARRGNDNLAIVLPEPLKTGERLQLRFVYGGPVLSDAGGGLLYVGARGTWYPNRGLAMADYDLRFRYPAGWTLVATGKKLDEPQQPLSAGGPELQSAHYVSERPIPVAGFNLGQYVMAKAAAGSATVETFAAREVERSFPSSRPSVVVVPGTRGSGGQQAITVLTPPPQPARHAQELANGAARSIKFLSDRLGPFPYSTLALTQMPGPVSQGWPGLVFLSSYVFVDPEDRAQARLTPYQDLVYAKLVEPHETAHQWWGDLMMARSYREYWLLEALANFCALLMLPPADQHAILEHYRQDLLARDAKGMEALEAGPVTLGWRLNSSRFPNAFETISYGRGTWLFHMLHTMLLESQPAGTHGDPLSLALKAVSEQHAGGTVSWTDIQKELEKNLPQPLWFEGKRSLDWFKDSWIDGTAVPHLELADVKFSSRGSDTVVTGKLLQKQTPSHTVTLVPLYGAGDGAPVLLRRVFADGAETSFRLTAPAGTRKLLIDPYQTLLSRP